MAKTKTKRKTRVAKPKRAKKAKATKVARRSQARPDRGKIHYLLRNIPKAVWKRFLATRSDARFDLLTYITKEAEKAPDFDLLTPEPIPAPEPASDVPSPAPVIQEAAEPEPAPEAQPETVNQ